MHRRARHLNYRDLGAVQSLDSRFISGESDGNALASWSDRSGNSYNMSQTNATYKPVYKTAIQGGQPIVRFETKYMDSSMAYLTKHTVIMLMKRTGSNTNAFNDATFAISYGQDGVNTSAGRLFQLAWASTTPTPVFAYFSLNSNSAEVTQTRDDNWNIHSISSDVGSGNAYYRINNASEASVNVSSGTGITSGTIRNRLGAPSWSATMFFIKGDVGVLAMGSTNWTTSQVKRAVHAGGYSFKIACS